jgi:hypothetical protein
MSKRQKSKQSTKGKMRTSRKLAIIMACLLGLSYFFKEVAKDKLKDLQDSLQSADALFRTESGQSVISLQMITNQQQIELLELRREVAKIDLDRDCSDVIPQALAEAAQVRSHVDMDFDSASRLIDKLPNAGGLLQLRETIRLDIQKMHQTTEGMFKPSDKHDGRRYVEIKLGMILELLQGLPVAILGDAALTNARKVQDAVQELYVFCSRAIYVLFAIEFCLGLYMTIVGFKGGEGSE